MEVDTTRCNPLRSKDVEGGLPLQRNLEKKKKIRLLASIQENYFCMSNSENGMSKMFGALFAHIMLALLRFYLHFLRY